MQLSKKYHTHYSGGVISSVLPDSIAEELELQPGDILLEINQQRMRDTIDYRFAISDEYIELLVQTSKGKILFDIEKDIDEDIGIDFAEPLFERPHICQNHCPFCFVSQMPKGMRKALYLKDDDYRLSFLYGNFITLTNMQEEDWQRIQEQHLSPLYVSVHATDRLLRAKLLGQSEVPDVREQIQQLGQFGIEIHAQIVANPGINDGAVLCQTIEELVELYPIVQSIAVVPVGITRYAPRQMVVVQDQTHEVRSYTCKEAEDIILLTKKYGNRYRHQLGQRMIYPADEFFLMCGRPIPSAKSYDGYPQYFNGIGLTRDFLDLWKQVSRSLPKHFKNPSRIALVCGTLIEPVMQGVVDQLNQIDALEVSLVPVINQFFGERVTVSGLLTGQDMIASLSKSQDIYDSFILPRVAFDHEGIRTLDDYYLSHIEQAVGIPGAIAGNPEELVALLQQNV